MPQPKQGPVMAGAFMLGFTFTLSMCELNPNAPQFATLPATELEANSAVVIMSQGQSVHAHCGAVAVQNNQGLTVLATAAHCVRHPIDEFDPAPNAETEARIGDTITYVTRHNWMRTSGYAAKATILTLDTARDKATLLPNQYECPSPLPKLSPCDRCSLDGQLVHIVSPVFDWKRVDGIVTGETYAGVGAKFFESSASIRFGFSGSPVLNENGQVIGIVIQCHSSTDSDGEQVPVYCLPGYSVFTSVP